MENNIGSSIIIEFNGLPGCGKSTVCRALENLLNEKKITTSQRYYRKAHHQHFSSLLFDYHSWIITFIAILYSLTIKPLRVRKLYPFVLASFYRMYRNFRSDNKNTVLLVDQGVIQAFVSLSFLDDLKINRLCKWLVMFYCSQKVKFVRIDCNSNIESAAHRIKSRLQHGIRFEKMTDDELSKNMLQQCGSFSKIRSLFDKCQSESIKIEMEKDPNENALIIYSRLFGRFDN